MPLRRPVPTFYVLAALVSSSALTAWWLMDRAIDPTGPTTAKAAPKDPCAMRINRVNGFGHIHPIVFARTACEAQRLAPLKGRVQALIAEERSTGALTRASIFLNDLTDGSWFSINGSEHFEPGSLMKVATMLAVLMKAELEPGFAERRFIFNSNIQFPHQQYAPSDDLVIGKEYSLGELLRYSIALSSNKAEAVLLQEVGGPAYQSMLSMMGLPGVDPAEGHYPIAAPDYARFFEALYGASLLGTANSELGLELLGHSEFTIGLRAGVPEGIDVASKFGETAYDGSRQLHEAALVYAEHRPYLVVVMTQGRTADELAGFLHQVSSTIYQHLTAPEYSVLAIAD